MHTLKMIKNDSCIYEFSVNDQFQKFFQAKDLITVHNTITAFLSKLALSNELPCKEENIFELTLDLTATQLEELLKLLVIGEHKEMIVLPKPLSLSKLHNRPIIYAHRSLDEFSAYWKHPHANLLKQRLFQQLAEDIIEVPYVDQPKDYETRFDLVAFHTNHGTTHGMRLVTLFNQFLRLFKSLPLNKAFSPEEEHCLQLAMFLFRSGRTNELGWSGDPSYSLRSAQIFTHIATKLGYKTSLIDMIARCFDYKTPLSMNKCDDQSLAVSPPRASLYQTLFALSHISDLVRCNSSYPTLAEKIKNRLRPFLDWLNEEELESITHQFLVFAAQCCQTTGAPMFIRDLYPMIQGSPFGSSHLAVRSVANFLTTFETLKHLPMELDEIIHYLREKIAQAPPEDSVQAIAHSTFFLPAPKEKKNAELAKKNTCAP